MTEENQQNERSGDKFERIKPAYVDLNQPEAQPGYREPESPVTAGIIVWALIGLLCMVGAVFLWLPGWISERQAADRASAVPAPTTTDAPAPTASPKPSGEGEDSPVPAPPDADALLDQREKAERLRGQVDELREELKAKGAPNWASTAWDSLVNLYSKAEREFSARNYELSTVAFSEALATARSISASADEVFARALQAGQSSLEANQSADARQAFEKALAVKPESAKAKAGLERARNRDAVLEAMRQGRNTEASGDLTVALDAYSRAVALDGRYKPATQAQQRLQRLVNEKTYRNRLSKALQQIDAGQYEQARTALQAAAAIRPDSEDVKDARARIDAALQGQAVAKHRKAAEAAVAEEQWADAKNAYQAALVVDPSLDFAQAGLEQATARAELHDQLTFHLDNPGRLGDPGVREAAQGLLTRAQAVNDPGPRLRRQSQALRSALQAAATPVPVTLRSDGQTAVVVHHVGELGQFQSKQLELKPGDYTAVGSRAGYRDVRKDFSVPVGAQSAGPVEVSCQEKI